MTYNLWPLKSRLAYAVAFALVAALAASLVIAGAVTPAAADRMVSVQPPSKTVAPGATFTLTVDIDDASHLAGFQFDVSYDESLISLDRIDPGALVAGKPGWCAC